MAVVFDRIYLHVIFCVRQASDPVQAAWIRPLELHLIAFLQSQGQALLGMAVLPDHVHILFRYRSGQPLGGLVRQVKKSAIDLLRGHFPHEAATFAWQKGYAAFSISSHNVDKVRAYLQEQPLYHQHYSVEEELVGMIRAQ